MKPRKPQISFQCSERYKQLVDRHIQESTDSLTRLCQVSLWHYLQQDAETRERIAREFAKAERTNFKETT